MTRESPVASIPGVGPAVTVRLAKLGIGTIGDLLDHFPRRYEDWTKLTPSRQAQFGQLVVLRGTIISVANERSLRRRLVLTKARIHAQDGGEVIATWFNQPFLARSLPIGQQRYFRGPVGFDRSSHSKTIINPQVAITPQLTPVYAATTGLSSSQIRRLIQRLVTAPETAAAEVLPESIRHQQELIGRQEAVMTLHQPASLAALATARRRVAFEELFIFFLQLARLRQNLRADRAPILQTPTADQRRFVQELPFGLTADQRRAAWQIIRGLGQAEPMNRLLEGDVGTGKTVVAAFAAFVTARSGYQTVILAPTTVLADQHVRTLSAILEPHGLVVGQWTGQIKTRGGTELPDVIVGTHALLHGQPPFGRIGLVVVDEQHRFGVEQRAVLRARRTDGLLPHFLSMTATPIPRTLALALYGDLAISRLQTRPAGRSEITTQVVHQPADRAAAYHYLRQEIAAGRQAFVVCPVIEDPADNQTLFPDLQQSSAQAEFRRLQQEIFPGLRIGLLHGKLAPAAKQRVMDEFRRGDLDILVATAVIEVGIDVPNATVMLVEGAERFGLSQLHQLRGRIGRGRWPATCFLMAAGASAEGLARLQHLQEQTTGFALAEIDLRLRGPGEFIGQHQTGFPPFRYADLFDFDLLARARAAAEAAINQPLSAELQRALLDTAQVYGE